MGRCWPSCAPRDSTRRWRGSTGRAPAALDAFLDGGLAEEEGGARLRCAPAHEAACYECAGALDLWPDLPRVVAPVRLVLGERGFVAPALRERLCAALPGTGIDVVPGGTHFVALEKPREVGEALARFLRERRDVDVA